jgi:four helix bundle protein
MAKVDRFEDLEVWKNARILAKLIYTLAQKGALSKDFGLRDQMQRASVSILSNIAEGFESQTQNMLAEYLVRAKGSAGELRAQLYLSLDLEYITENEFNEATELVTLCSKQLTRFIQYLHSTPNARRVNEDGATYHV